MIKHFYFFDILWCTSNNKEKLEEWRAFTNVNVLVISQENQFIKNIVEEKNFNLIIIMSGEFAEKTVPKLQMKMHLPNIIIYSNNLDYYKN